MMPPKLTLVSRNDNIEETQRDEPEAAEAVELARALSETEQSEIEPEASPDFDAHPAERREKLRILEALLFAASEPLDEERLASHIGPGEAISTLVAELQRIYSARGVNLVRVAGKWAFRTAVDLSYLLEKHAVEERRLSKAALETMAIIAYHQPVTRAEIEDIRGVTTSAGTLDILMEAGWIRPRGRRRAPGKPLTYGTTESFLAHFGLDTVKDLPGLADLKAAGLLDGTLPPGFTVPDPMSIAALMPDELPLEAGEDEEEDAETDEDAGDEDVEAISDSGLPESGGDDKSDEPGT
jgi:segregation and condensation protein B